MALFERSPVRGAEAAAAKEKAAKQREVEARRAEHAGRVGDRDAAFKAVEDIRAELAAAEPAAVEAIRAGQPVPDIASIRTRLEQAELLERAAAKLVEEALSAMEVAEEELTESAEAHRCAVCAAMFARLAAILEGAVPLDEELERNGGACLGLASLAARARASAEELTQSVASKDTEIAIGSWAGNTFQSRLVRLDIALRELASNEGLSFCSRRDERRYGAQVEALRKKLAEQAEHIKVAGEEAARSPATQPKIDASDPVRADW